MTALMREAQQPRSLPRPIRRSLARLGTRLRVISAMRGSGRAACALAIAAALAMTSDVMLELPPTARWIIWAVWFAGVALSVAGALVYPLVRPIAWNELAALAERGEPTLGERLTSAVAFVHGPAHGSPELARCVVDDAADRAGRLDFKKQILKRGAVAWFLAGVLTSTAVVMPAIVRPEPFALIGKRFLFPWVGIERVGRFAVVVSPGDKVVALGSNVVIVASVRSRFGEPVRRDAAWLEWVNSDGTTNREAMTAEPGSERISRSFASTLNGVSGSLSYRVKFANDASRRYALDAVEPPRLISLKALVQPPAYTKRPAAAARDSTRIEAWEDSKITMELEASRPLKEARLLWPSPVTAPESSAPSPSTGRVLLFTPGDNNIRWVATARAEMTGPFAVTLVDTYDSGSKAEAPRRVIVRADAPPTVTVRAPVEFKETNRYDAVALTFGAADDVAVASAGLHYQIDRGQGSTGSTAGDVDAVLEGAGTPRARGRVSLNLGTLALAAGDVVSYRVRVADNRPAPRGPNVAWSPTYRVQIVEHSESIQARQVLAERTDLRARLDVLLKRVITTRDDVGQLRNQADAASRGHDAWDEVRDQRVARNDAATHAIIDELQRLARDFENHPTFEPLARPTRQVAEVESAAAAATLAAARHADDLVKRSDELEKARQQLGQVVAKVDEVKRRFDELTRFDDDRRKLTDLAQREENLALRAERSAGPEDRAKLDALASEHERLEHDLNDVLKNSPALKDVALAAHAQEADELAARARALADDERKEARRSAADGERSAALKDLAARQRAIEDDARQLAIRLDGPLSQNGRARVDVNTLDRAGTTMESGNFQQARDRVVEAENALVRLRRDVEDVPQDMKALARRLAHRQELLRGQTADAVRGIRDNPPQTPEGKAALAGRIQPFIDRQATIARLTAAIVAAPELKDVLRDATEKTARAHADLRESKPKDVETHQAEARDALNRLAEALPDPNQARDRARQKVNEARSRHEEIARDLETHLRETMPKPGQPHDPVKAAADFAQRVAGLVAAQRELANLVGAIDPESRATPQRDRAAQRALDLANALEAVRQKAPAQAPADSRPSDPKTLTSWRLLGAFPIDKAIPFAADRPIDLSAKYTDRKGQPALWTAAAPVDAQGTIDLGQIYGKEDKLAAFGMVTIESSQPRTAQMHIGSDDSMTVWQNGKIVYDFQGSRSYQPTADRFDVSLLAGNNPFIIKCGNLNGEWKFAMAVTPEPERFRPLTDWHVIGPFASSEKAPFALDAPIALDRTHTGRKGKAAAWKVATPVNDKGAVDLAAFYATRDKGVAAFGVAEIESPTARQARLMIGSNDTFTVWLNGTQVYDSQVSRSWAPDQARVNVPLQAGTNRLVVKCGNTGGNWMYSVAVADQGDASRMPRNDDVARGEPTFEHVRQALPAFQVAARAALERLQQKIDGQTPADDMAAMLADDQREWQAAASPRPGGQTAPRAELAAAERRIANAVANLEAPDAAVARAEAIKRALEAAHAVEDDKNDQDPQKTSATLALAASAIESLAKRVNDAQSPKERIGHLARASGARGRLGEERFGRSGAVATCDRRRARSDSGRKQRACGAGHNGCRGTIRRGRAPGGGRAARSVGAGECPQTGGSSARSVSRADPRRPGTANEGGRLAKRQTNRQEQAGARGSRSCYCGRRQGERHGACAAAASFARGIASGRRQQERNSTCASRTIV